MKKFDFHPGIVNAYKYLYQGTVSDKYLRQVFADVAAERDALRALIGRMFAATTLPRLRALSAEFEAIDEIPTPGEYVPAYDAHRAEIVRKDYLERRKREEEEARLERVRRAQEELRRIEARERRIAELKAIIATGGKGFDNFETAPITVERDPNELPPPVILTPEEAKKKAMADTAMLIAAMESGNREALSI